MFDPITQGLAAASARSAYAAPLVFTAGVFSSMGPCVAPRFVAVAGLAAGKSRKKACALVVAFICGLVLVYALFGAVSSLFREAAVFSHWTYWVVAITLMAGGCAALWRDQPSCSGRHARAHTGEAGIGAAFLLGASFALVLSPCCTPVVLGILTYTSAAGDARYGSLLLACYALGHVLPIVAVAFGANGTANVLARYTVRQAAGVVSAALMLGLAGYYALLA